MCACAAAAALTLRLTGCWLVVDEVAGVVVVDDEVVVFVELVDEDEPRRLRVVRNMLTCDCCGVLVALVLLSSANAFALLGVSSGTDDTVDD